MCAFRMRIKGDDFGTLPRPFSVFSSEVTTLDERSAAETGRGDGAFPLCAG